MGTNKDYLAIDSSSMARVISSKLSENTAFTDQLFKGSDLSVLVEGFSYMYTIMQYYLNHGASEAMFEDATLFENINRTVKLIGYNPVGHIGPSVEGFFKNLSVDPSESATPRIDSTITPFPKYTMFSTNKVDRRGLPVFYSMTSDESPTITSDALSNDENSRITLTNGRWTLYSRTFISSGLPFETLILDDLLIDSTNIDEIRYVSHPNVDVYVKRNDEYLPFQTVTEGTLIGELDSSTSSLEDNRVELRINENFKYTLKFGDGVHGSRLINGDEVYIVYLDGNGPGSEIGASAIVIDGGSIEFAIDGANEELYLNLTGFEDSAEYDTILNDDTSQFDIIASHAETLRALTADGYVYFSNTSASGTYLPYESVDEIKENAPNWFRQGNTLTTTDSYRNFMLREYKGILYDVSVMNNYQYMTEFMLWLNSIRDCEGGTRLKAEIRNYPITDSCDFNNVYIWSRFKGESPVSIAKIESVLYPRKGATTEPIILNALDMMIVPCLSETRALGEKDLSGEYPCSIDNLSDRYDYRFPNIADPSRSGWDPYCENFIEIEKDPNSIITDARVKEHVTRVFLDFFKADNQLIGGLIDVQKLYTSMRSVEGVKNIRTVYQPMEQSGPDRIPIVGIDPISVEGLSFAGWTQDVAGSEDRFLFTGSLSVKNFQFPRLTSLGTLRISERFQVKYRTTNTPNLEF